MRNSLAMFRYFTITSLLCALGCGGASSEPEGSMNGDEEKGSSPCDLPEPMLVEESVEITAGGGSRVITKGDSLLFLSNDAGALGHLSIISLNPDGDSKVLYEAPEGSENVIRSIAVYEDQVYFMGFKRLFTFSLLKLDDVTEIDYGLPEDTSAAPLFAKVFAVTEKDIFLTSSDSIFQIPRDDSSREVRSFPAGDSSVTNARHHDGIIYYILPGGYPYSLDLGEPEPKSKIIIENTECMDGLDVNEQGIFCNGIVGFTHLGFDGEVVEGFGSSLGDNQPRLNAVEFSYPDGTILYEWSSLRNKETDDRRPFVVHDADKGESKTVLCDVREYKGYYPAKGGYWIYGGKDFDTERDLFWLPNPE